MYLWAAVEPTILLSRYSVHTHGPLCGSVATLGITLPTANPAFEIEMLLTLYIVAAIPSAPNVTKSSGR